MDRHPGTRRRLPRHQGSVSRGTLFALLFFQTVGWKQFGFFDLVAVSALLAIMLHALMTPQTEAVRRALPAIMGLVVLACYSLIIAIGHDGLDPQFALRSMRAALNLAGVAALVDLYVQSLSGRQDSAEVVAADGFLVLAVHGFLMIVMYVQPAVRGLVYSVTDAHSNVNLNFPFLSGLRITGLTYGLSQTSALQASALALGLANIRYWYRSYPRIVTFVFGCATTGAAILISGRSGLVIAALAIVFGTWSAWRQEVCPAAGPLPRGRLLASLGIAMMLTWIAVPLLPQDFTDYSIKMALRLVDQPLTELPVYETTLGSNLSTPEDMGDYLFGTSGLGRGALGVIDTDIGYLRMWHAVGLVGLLGSLAILGLLLAQTWRHNLLAIGTFAITWILLLNIKELALFTRNQWTIQALILLIPSGAQAFKRLESVTTPSDKR